MSKTQKRTYTSYKRDAAAIQTRSRILASAKELFQTEGFDLTTIEKIAVKASVSIPTVYALFQSKRGILRVLMDEALPPDEFQALVEKGKAEKSPKKRLQITAQIARRIYDAERSEIDLLRSAAGLAPELKELEREREERRYLRQKETVEALSPSSIPLERARDLIWAFTGRDFYRMLVLERRWSSDEYEKWLANLLYSTLFSHRLELLDSE
ncbi:MAG: TetR/AcrR family transcriptional regulator [Verrucomicrobia bacterium]|nr:TetR/AcrR family transcriptional regulator [Verrucomicrobiota bacterium]